MVGGRGELFTKSQSDVSSKAVVKHIKEILLLFFLKKEVNKLFLVLSTLACFAVVTTRVGPPRCGEAKENDLSIILILPQDIDVFLWPFLWNDGEGSNANNYSQALHLGLSVVFS